MSSYLALHRATLTMPVMSPPLRWALTPPFHPYLIRNDKIATYRFGHRRSILCGAGVGSLRLGVTQRLAHEVRTFLFERYRPKRSSDLLPRARILYGRMSRLSSAPYEYLVLLYGRQECLRNRPFGLVDSHGLRHPLFQLVDACPVARVCGHKL